MGFENEGIVIEIIEWLVEPAPERTHEEFIDLINIKLPGSQNKSRTKTKLLIDYVAFELREIKYCENFNKNVNPKSPLNLRIRENIQKIANKHLNTQNITLENANTLMKIPSKLEEFLIKNELQIDDLFLIYENDINKIKSIGSEGLEYIYYYMYSKELEFINTGSIFDLIKDPISLLSDISCDVISDLTEQEIREICIHGPEKFPGYSRIGEMYWEEISEYLSFAYSSDYTKARDIGYQYSVSDEIKISDKEITKLLTKIEHLDISVRLNNIFTNSNIVFLGQVACLKENAFLRLPNAGKKSWNEVSKIISDYNLYKFSNIEWSDPEEIEEILGYKKIELEKELSGETSELFNLPANEANYLLTPVKDVEISDRLSSLFEYLKIKFLGQIACLTKREVVRTPNVGDKSWDEICKIITDYDLGKFSNIEWPDNEEIEKTLIKKTSRKNKKILTAEQEAINLEDVRIYLYKNKLKNLKKYNKKLSALDLHDRELMLTPVKFFNFSVRVTNVLRQLNIKYFGQVVLLNEGEFLRAANAGRKSWAEINEFLVSNDLYRFSSVEWPDNQELDEIINQTALELGKGEFGIVPDYLIFSCPSADTIEAEADGICSQIVSLRELKVLRHRLGIGGVEALMTLEELSISKIASENVLTRERIRQIESKAIRKVNSQYISPDLIKNCIETLFTKTIFRKDDLNKEIIESGFSNYADPVKLIQRLCGILYKTISYNFQHVEFRGETLLINSIKCDVSLLKRFLKKVNQQVRVSEFSEIPPEAFDALGNGGEDLKAALIDNRNLICIPSDGVLFITKKPWRLLVGRNRSITPLAKIFEVSKSANLKDLFEGFIRSRTAGAEIPFEVFSQFISKLEFFDIKDEVAWNLGARPRGGLTKGDLVILNLAKQFGDVIDTKTLQHELVRCGFSSGAARQVAIFSPLIFSIRKGSGYSKGLFKIIGSLDYLDENIDVIEETVDEYNIEINIDIKIKLFGTFSLDNKIFEDGEYKVFDNDDNLICTIENSGMTLSGLKPLVLGEEKGKINLKYEPNSQSFFIE